ncbi:MAG: DUF1364 family protein [Sphingomonadales bacterium]|nr:MAG: DUF1364 family protein [Sphingomonadales bacterium]
MISGYRPHLLPKVRSEHIMAAAAGMPCTLRIASFYPGHQCAGHETTVACHLPVGGKGISTKVTDLAVAFGCKHCHDILDGADWKRQEYITDKFGAAVIERLLWGHVETMTLLHLEGLLHVPGSRTIGGGNWKDS